MLSALNVERGMKNRARFRRRIVRRGPPPPEQVRTRFAVEKARRAFSTKNGTESVERPWDFRRAVVAKNEKVFPILALGASRRWAGLAHFATLSRQVRKTVGKCAL